MQSSVHLNQKDIVRLQKAIGKLLAIGEALLGKNGHSGSTPPVKVRKKRARRGPSVPPSGSSSPE